MTNLIQGLHHVTSMAQDARRTDQFFNQVLGLRRIKQTVNFDAPDVYHLYYGDGVGTPGSVMTYFPFPNIAPGRAGTGAVGRTVFAVPPSALSYWQARLGAAEVGPVVRRDVLGAARLDFKSPDGEQFALLEVVGDDREPWAGAGVSSDVAIRGFHSVELRLTEVTETAELLTFMGYRRESSEAGRSRFVVDGLHANAAHTVDLIEEASAGAARLGAGSVHHVAFAVEDRVAHDQVRQMIADTGYQVTPPIDRDYFWAIYFRTPGGVLFEVSTNDPGFACDEPSNTLGEALKLPAQHEHLRGMLEQRLAPLGGQLRV